MRTDPGWHDLLDAAVPKPDVATDALGRLDQAVARARGQRRIRRVAVPAAVLASAAVTLGLTTPWDSGHGVLDRITVRHPTSPVGATDGLTGTVAYKCGNFICLMSPGGGGQRTLLATTPEWDPSWSPDGQRLAFRGYYATGDGAYAIYVVDADGCHATRLPGTNGGLTPTWSPDGTQLAFGPGRIQVINADGSHPHAITNGGQTVNDRWTDSQPAWSSTGQIAFVRTPHTTTAGQIYTMAPDGSQLTAITRGGTGFAQPAWSPDGAKLAMVAAINGNTQIGTPMQIDVTNADGTDQHSVSPPAWSSYAPTWTPDGRIVFLVDNGSTDAYIVNPDGSDLHRLYHDLGGTAGALQITWGPTRLIPPSC
jgi:Tol biopolymer transport system component